jgi:hypothetical protein
MNQSSLLLSVNVACDEAVSQIVERVRAIGWRVMRSFNLQAAREAHLECTCPHHGTARCDCQMVVLLVYMDTGEPLTLIAHGRAGNTQFALADSSNPDEIQRAGLEMVLRAVFRNSPRVKKRKYRVITSEQSRGFPD